MTKKVDVSRYVPRLSQPLFRGFISMGECEKVLSAS